MRALFTETWSPHVVLSLTFWLNYSASFLHWIFLLSYPYSITLYILNQRLIKQLFPDPRRRRPRFKFPGSTGAGPRHLLFNMLPRLVITFLPRSKHLLISWMQSPSAVIFEPPKIKSDTEICKVISNDLCLSYWLICHFIFNISILLGPLLGYLIYSHGFKYNL